MGHKLIRVCESERERCFFFFFSLYMIWLDVAAIESYLARHLSPRDLLIAL